MVKNNEKFILNSYKILFAEFGSQGWWPINNRHHQGKPKTNKNKFEVCIGAILTQNTSWKNVEKSIANLMQHNLLEPKKIAAINQKKLAELIRSSGYYNQKAKSLKVFSQYVMKNYGGNLSRMFGKDVQLLRTELLSIKGIGPETADSIILYSAEKPIFVIDAYTKRVFSRIGVCDENRKYNDLQNIFMNSLKDSKNKTELFKEYHALIVALGKNHCKKKQVCRECPLSKSCLSNRPSSCQNKTNL